MAVGPRPPHRAPVVGDTDLRLKPKHVKPRGPVPKGRSTLRMFLSMAKAARRTPAAKRGSPWLAVKQWQKVVVKLLAKSSSHSGGQQWKRHGIYLQRARACEERGGFDREREAGVDLAEKLEGWQRAEDPEFQKIVLSPEAGREMDVKQLTREFMAQLEKDRGAKLDWGAAVHENTGQTHVHIAIRGLDSLGRKVEFSLDYARDRMRRYACEIATDQLGYAVREQGRERERTREREPPVRP